MLVPQCRCDAATAIQTCPGGQNCPHRDDPGKGFRFADRQQPDRTWASETIRPCRSLADRTSTNSRSRLSPLHSTAIQHHSTPEVLRSSLWIRHSTQAPAHSIPVLCRQRSRIPESGNRPDFLSSSHSHLSSSHRLAYRRRPDRVSAVMQRSTL